MTVLAARRHVLSPFVHAVDVGGALCSARPVKRWRSTTALPINCPKCLYMLEHRYAFCEPATAGSSTYWHVRRLAATGLHLGGGCDTRALCGATVAWDLQVPVTRDAIRDTGVCPSCSHAFLAL